MGSFIYRCKQNLSFDGEEFTQLLVTAIVAGFVVSFNNWGSGETVNISAGLTNLAYGAVFAFIGVGAHLFAQKLAGIKLGYAVKYTYWKLGLLIGGLITFLTNGFIPLFFPGGVQADALEEVRVGKYQPRFKIWEFGVVSFAGPVANMLLVLLMKPVYLSTGASWAYTFIIVNLLIMIFSMLPLPFFHGVKVIESGRTGYDFQGGTIGFNLFLASRPLFIFFFLMVLAYTALILITGLFSLLLSAVIALAITVVFYMSTERY